ncbi:ATP-binding cassette domain-containing protein [Pleurocapsales cyanobacterium LEGE 06147]|nr:ATP-binding cassette domain-containing protein [Pleurocapsales cyanobacterium LEGE 06147]
MFSTSLVSSERLELFLRDDSSKWEQSKSREVIGKAVLTQIDKSVVLKSVLIGGDNDDTRILKSVNLSFESGKIYGLAGRTGSGKSTLLTSSRTTVAQYLFIYTSRWGRYKSRNLRRDRLF